MDASPPSSTSSAASFPVLAITLLGMLTTAFVLISYYLLVVKCRLSWSRRIFLPSAHPRRHPQLDINPPLIHAIAAAELHGLDPAVIRSIPVVKFARAAGAGAGASCAICLSEFREEERVKLLPGCAHAFHIDCIDTWLEFNANCPLCRTVVTSCPPGPVADHIVILAPRRESGRPADEEEMEQVSLPARSNAIIPSPRWKWSKCRKVGSMGDEFIDVRGKCEQFSVQPMRRSFSMDSSNDRQLYLSIQEILRQKEHCPGSSGGEGSSGRGGSGRIRRSLFFSLGRSSRSSVLPIEEAGV